MELVKISEMKSFYCFWEKVSSAKLGQNHVFIKELFRLGFSALTLEIAGACLSSLCYMLSENLFGPPFNNSWKVLRQMVNHDFNISRCTICNSVI